MKDNSRRANSGFFSCGLLVLFATNALAQQDYTIFELAGPGQAITGNYSGNLGGPSINNDGKVAFFGSISGTGFRFTTAIFLDDGLESSPSVPIYINRPATDPECQQLVPVAAERGFRCIDNVWFNVDVDINDADQVAFETIEKSQYVISEIVAGDGTLPLRILLQRTQAPNGRSYDFPSYYTDELLRGDFNNSGYTAAWMNELDDLVNSSGCTSLMLGNGTSLSNPQIGAPQSTNQLPGRVVIDSCNPPDVQGEGASSYFSPVIKAAFSSNGTRALVSADVRTGSGQVEGLYTIDSLGNGQLKPVVADSTYIDEILMAINDNGDVVYTALPDANGYVLRTARTSNPGSFTTIASAGTYSSIDNLAINNSGTIVFTADLAGGGGGLFIYDPASRNITPLMQRSDPYPSGTAQVPPDTIASVFLGERAINDSGEIVAQIQVTKAAGGNERKIIKFSPALGVPEIAVADNVGVSDDRAIDFGSVLVNESATATVTVNNFGTGDLNMGPIEIPGADTAHFHVANDACSRSAVAPGGSCQFDVTFTPDNTVDFSSTVSIPSNDPVEPLIWISLAGEGDTALLRLIEPDAQSTDGRFDYGPYTVGSRTRRSFVLHNFGSRDLSILRYDNIASPFDGPYSAIFGSIPAGGSTNFEMDFAPVAVGTASQTINIVYIDLADPSTGEKTLTLELSGEGVNAFPILDIATEDASPGDSLLDFGTIVVQAQLQKAITITNNGGGTLDLYGGGNSNAAYTITGNSCDDAHLLQAESCTVDVRFSPTAPGDYDDVVSLQYGDPTNASPLSIQVTGSAVDAPITISDSIDPADDHDLPFGFIEPGNTLTATIDIYNNLSETVTLGQLAAATQTLSAPFSIINDGCSGITLSAAAQVGDNCQLGVQLAPPVGSAEGDVAQQFGIPVTAPVAVEFTVTTDARIGNSQYDLRLLKAARSTDAEIDDITPGNAALQLQDRAG